MTVTFIAYISCSHQSYSNLILILSLHLNMTFPYHSGNFFMISHLIASFVGASVIDHG
jgi:hypothetical protein